MCLAVVALAAHPSYPLVVAANRDEFHARAALPAHWGGRPPYADMLAGRDAVAGGTWMGVRRDGRWALVTNVRDGYRNDTEAPSRGELVPAILNAVSTPAMALAELKLQTDPYNGFNLLAGDVDSATWMSNRVSAAQPLAQGIHGLSNARLDTPWPKLARTKAAVSAWVTRGDDDLSPLFTALADRTRAPDEDLPATGVPVEWERLLSAPFIVSDDYGTRCSTVLIFTHDGEARFVERSFDARGNTTGDAEFAFKIRRAQVS
jgi:uncharacterized protein with NRDE domain